jgi:hypothetical protein
LVVGIFPAKIGIYYYCCNPSPTLPKGEGD